MENELNIKDVIDPMGLLSEPTSDELKEWEQSPHLSDNPYVLIGWLVNHRKNKLEESLKDIVMDVRTEATISNSVEKIKKLDKLIFIDEE